MDQRIGFVTSPDGARIAYAISGSGPPLVKAPNWLSHLEFEATSPVWAHWWAELAKEHRLIRFDQRGCGLSDWLVDDMSFEAWVSDLESVVEATGADRFPLLGISQGGSVAIEYAVRHPERVSHLILYGAYPRGSAKRGMPRDEFEARLALARMGWGRDNPAYRQIFTSEFMPDATAEQMQWFNELQRVSASPENAVRIMSASSQIDVLDRLPQVSVPTLVIHAQRDARIAFEQGRQLASLIPGARLVAVDSKNHLLLESEPAWQVVISEMRRFIGDDVGPVPSPPMGDGAAELSRRELEVLQLIVSGKSNQQIADALFISVKTAGNHVSNILSKTNATNRSEAVAYAFRHGIV